MMPRPPPLLLPRPRPPAVHNLFASFVFLLILFCDLAFYCPAQFVCVISSVKLCFFLSHGKNFRGGVGVVSRGEGGLPDVPGRQALLRWMGLIFAYDNWPSGPCVALCSLSLSRLHLIWAVPHQLFQSHASLHRRRLQPSSPHTPHYLQAGHVTLISRKWLPKKMAKAQKFS